MLKSKFQEALAAARRFLADEAGLSATEYAVLFIVIVAAIVAGAALLGPAIIRTFQRGADALDSAGP